MTASHDWPVKIEGQYCPLKLVLKNQASFGQPGQYEPVRLELTGQATQATIDQSGKY